MARKRLNKKVVVGLTLFTFLTIIVLSTLMLRQLQKADPKHFVALAPASQLATVFARDESDRVSAFIVDTSADGYQMREPCETMGARGLCPAVIYLDEVRVAKDNRIGE